MSAIPQSPGEAGTEAAVEAPIEAPAETTAEGPVEAPIEAPAETAAEVPGDTAPQTSAIDASGHVARSIDHRRERIRVETQRHRIEGYVTLARDGFRSRVSDMLNASERDFLTLTDATITPLDGGPAETHRFLAVARGHIVFAVVAEATGESSGA